MVHVGDVALVDLQVHAQVHGRPQVVLDVLALQLADGFLEQLRVHLEADGFQGAALLAAEEGPRAADLEVQRRHAEAAAQIAELLDRGEPLLRDLRQAVLAESVEA